ncbi:uncharacterized protein M6B38_260895 [Iris pallida]|uniref:DUF7032 domain-containing protein n=1 Tax=Iris pallida TaxID=29817 RepID=A0AAX6ID42_IRIPA|nr:uncharacterized protein M6B38_260895 [Iris pallida]
MLEESGSADRWLARTLRLVPVALDKAKSARCFLARWASISSKLERIPPCLSDLSGRPLFAGRALCLEQLQALSAAVSETIELADRCADSSSALGKLRTQSDLDAVAARLDLLLRDCRLLIRTGALLGESSLPDASARCDVVCELLVRLQIGQCGAKQRAVDGLLEALRDDEGSVVALLGRSDVSALVQLLSAAAPKTREKAAAVVCLLAGSGSCESLLVSEGVLPPLIRLIESGSSAARENAALSLQRLSTSADTARSIAGHGGTRPLIEACRIGIGDSVSQLAAACTLKNLSAVPELAQSLVDEGVARVMIDVLDSKAASGPKEHAAECLRNLTSNDDDDSNLRLAVVSEGGVRSLVAYLDAPSPQEHAAGALSNLVDLVSADTLISLGVLPRLVHVLKDGSPGARQAAASAIAKISDSSSEMGRLVGAFGCVPLLVALLDAKSSATRGVAARAISSLMASCPHNRREVRREGKSVPGLVQLLDPSPQNAAANEHAVRCLLCVASSGRCRRMMVAYGAIGYLKKLVEMDVPGAKKLLGRLEGGGLRNLFSKN